MTDAASLIYEQLNEYKAVGPDIGIVDGPLEYFTTSQVADHESPVVRSRSNEFSDAASE